MNRLKAEAEAKARKKLEELKKKKVERVPKPVRLNIVDISRSGMVTIGFNQILSLPFFARNQTNNPLPEVLKKDKGKRKLVSMQDINVARDVVSFQYVFRQDQEPKNFTYALTLIEWTPINMKVEIDFSKPLMVSRGNLQDEIVLVVKDRKLFMNPYGEMVDQKKSIIVKPLPRQVPKGVDAAKLEDQAKNSGDAMKVFFIIQLVISFILKGSIDYLFSFFLTLQIIVEIVYYDLNIPANVELYLREIGKIVRFELLNPEKLIQL